MPEDDALADLLAFVLAGRPERLTAAAVAQMAPEHRAGVGLATETVAALAFEQDPIVPGHGLRERILSTLQARSSQTQRKALLVCDMLVDHLTPGRPLEVPRARAIVPAVARRIDDARARGVPVVYILDRHSPDDPELEEWGDHAIEGTAGAEVWPPLAPKPGDHLVTKPTYSAFHESNLAQVLEKLEVDTLVLTGCLTEVHMLATATDALQRGFEVEMPSDAQAGMSAQTEQVAMAILAAVLPYAPARRALLERIQSAA
jgi:nicotinamidase/pyrazinamidase